MAASSANSIRVRLYFDYPPPAVSDCRMCWVLVDLNRCRVVADLASIIRDKFSFSRRNVLSLYMEDCYLPHTESIYVVRDNDSIRVKVDCLNGVEASHHSSPASGKLKKRGRDEEEGPPGNLSGIDCKRKKAKRKKEESQKNESKQMADADGKKRKLKKKQDKSKASTPSKAPCNTAAPQAGKGSKKPPAAPASVPVNGQASTRTLNAASSSSDSSDDSSEEEEAPKKTIVTPKRPTKTVSYPIPTATKVTSKAKTATTTKPQAPSSSSSSETDSSSDEEAPSKTSAKPVITKTPPAKPVGIKTPPAKPVVTKTPPAKPAASRPNTTLPSPKGDNPTRSESVSSSAAPSQTLASSHQAPEKLPEGPGRSSSDSSSEEEIQLVIKRPVMGMGFIPALDNPSGRGRGTPRGREWCRGNDSRRGGRREDRGSFHFNYEDRQQQQQPSHQSGELTNTVLLQTPAETEAAPQRDYSTPQRNYSAPQRDYSAMPLLAAPPQLGKTIAFKLLELTENYTPEVSAYKEGKLISFDPTNKQMELELLSGTSQAPLCPGKFDLVYENPDGSESVEYAVSRGSRVTERWESLLEPRLVV